MRDLKQSDKNVLKINDAISGSEIELHYRMPTTSEQVAYQSRLIKRQGKKVIINAFDTRLEFGLKIITGFGEGNFGFDGKPISTDKNSPNYRDDWKELIRQSAPDIINAFAMTVFEGARVEQDVDMEYEEVGENPPFSTQ
ncbi:MAG TPA: hypothetical protein ACFYEK_09110 [Candidatus Wunengus sp. YC60]|uniref:hypothetical protein n=1 Tax=Candidatus Wunengus sp. YC60 TaxID=3367697 RepID=UPI0040259563